MVLRSSLHRVRDAKKKNRTAAPPRVTCELPAALRGEAILAYDCAEHDLHGALAALLASAPCARLGAFGGDPARPRLEDFRLAGAREAWDALGHQRALTDAVAADADGFLAAFETLVETVVLPHVKRRLAAARFGDGRGARGGDGGDGGDGPARRRFWVQYPPTVRLQPGPSDVYVNPHSDAVYGHQPGELNFWMPLTPYRPRCDAPDARPPSAGGTSVGRALGAGSRTTLWAESAAGAGDYHPLEVEPGQIAVFHGSLCRHHVPANPTRCTRASLDFRVGVDGCFDPEWVLRGTKADHNRREMWH